MAQVGLCGMSEVGSVHGYRVWFATILPPVAVDTDSKSSSEPFITGICGSRSLAMLCRPIKEAAWKTSCRAAVGEIPNGSGDGGRGHVSAFRANV